MTAINLFAQNLETEPCLRVEFKLLLSVNDLDGLDRFQTAGIKKTWRERGAERLVETMKQRGVPTQAFVDRLEKKYQGRIKTSYVRGERLVRTFFNEPCFLWVRLWKANNVTFDVPNLLIKPVVDGFVDARLMPNDNTDYLPFVLFGFEGVDRTLELSAEKRAARAEYRAELKERGSKKPVPPPPNKRIWFDFWRLERLYKINPNFLLTNLSNA